MRVKVKTLIVDNEGIWYDKKDKHLIGVYWNRVKDIKYISFKKPVKHMKPVYNAYYKISSLFIVFTMIAAIYIDLKFLIVSALLLIPILISKPVIRVVLTDNTTLDLVMPDQKKFEIYWQQIKEMFENKKKESKKIEN